MCQEGAQHYFKRTHSKIREKKEMGQVTEYEEIMEDLEKLKNDTAGIILASAGINRCTNITLSVLPLTYDLMINGGLVHSFNELENAKKVYDIIRADYAGRVHHG